MANVVLNDLNGLNSASFWVANSTISQNETFENITSSTGSPILGLQTVKYSSFMFTVGDLKYIYSGEFEVNVNRGVLDGSAQASGTYSSVTVQRAGQTVAEYTHGVPQSVDFGSVQNVSLVNLLLDAVGGLLFGGGNGGVQNNPANLFLDTTPGLPQNVFAESDTITGTSSSDVIFGYGGNDSIVGNAGHDTLVGGDGSDFINGGNGGDYLEGDGGADTILGGDGNDVIYGDGSAGGTAGDDWLEGGLGSDVIFGQDGNDTLFGQEGDDTIVGGAGNDLVVGGAGNDTLQGDGGADTLVGGDGSDIIFGDGAGGGVAGNDWIEAGFGNDTVLGQAGNDTIFGQDGNDVIYGGDGFDVLYGGAGSDNFHFSRPGDGYDYVGDFTAGQDALVFESVNFGGLNQGNIASRFYAGAGFAGFAVDGPFFAYDTTTGNLWYNNAGSPTLIAQLAASTLSASDIFFA